MTRLYNIDGWHTYQDLHDRLGYTMQPSAEVSYVLSSDSSWGDDAGNHGYFSGLPDTDDQYDPSDGEYFEVDVYGWCSLDELLSDVGLMPSNADTSILMQKGSTMSKSAVIAPPRLDPIYCVSAELESGWHTYDWWEDNGWEEAQPSSSLLFGGDFSGNNISLDSVDGGGSVINRYNPGRALFPNTGWVDGTMITRYNPGRALFELRGWEPGGVFEKPPEKMTLGGIITDISSTSFEADAVEPMAQGSIEFTGDLLAYTMPSISIGPMAQGSIEFTGDLLTYTMPSIGGIIEEV